MVYNSARVENIGPDQLDKKMQSCEDLFLLDVRTPAEHSTQAIEGSHLIPLQELGYRLHELPKDKEIVVYCRTGNRSAYAGAWLAQQGYSVKNLDGGIVQWNMSGFAAATRISC